MVPAGLVDQVVAQVIGNHQTLALEVLAPQYKDLMAEVQQRRAVTDTKAAVAAVQAARALPD
jgi:hypothetical protein